MGGAEINTLPLFPLRTVLFPGGRLPLKVFEQRYIDLVRDSIRDATGFGICMLAPGDEGQTGIARIGTLASIEDWYLRDDGLLGVTVLGTRRFRLGQTWAQDNGLLCAKVEWLPDLDAEIPPECSLLVSLLRQIVEQTEISLPDMTEVHLDQAAYVSNRLAELLPLELLERQQLLEMDDPVERLRREFILLRYLQERQNSEDDEVPDDD